MLIEARGLSRSFRTFDRRPGLVGALRDLFALGGEERTAVAGLDLDIDHGELVALIGPNGAGKSTTVKMLTGILRPTGGTLHVDGRVPHLERHDHVRNIGVVFGQRTQLWWDLAVVEALHLLAAVFEVPQADFDRRMRAFDEVLGIGPMLAKPVRELSLGQRMRCDLAAALLHGPKALFLDEPTIGLDVAVKQRIRAFLRQLNEEEGTTILLTTHDLQDVEALCRRIVLIDQGAKLFDGTVPSLLDELGGRRRLVVTVASRPDQEPSDWGVGVEATWREFVLTLSFDSRSTELVGLVGRVLAQLDVADIAIEEPSIESLVTRFYDRASA